MGFGIAGVPGANSGISVIDNAAAVIGVPNTNGIAMGTAATYNPDTFGGGFCSCFTLAFPPSWWVQVNSQAGNGITALHGGSVAIYDSIVSVPQVPLAADTGAKNSRRGVELFRRFHANSRRIVVVAAEQRNQH